ncbi:MAG: alpha-amylase family glycosyl hydrolase [Ruminococcus sp.]
MKNKSFKVISLVLALCMLLSCAAVTGVAVNATETEQTVSQSLPNTQSNVQDGVILHAFNWSYNTIKDNLPNIAAAGYSTVQTSPVQQPKDYGGWYKVADQWPKLYQPLNFSIASQTWLGTKEELASLCEEAHKYGIKIICDVVTNHLANNMATDKDEENIGVLYSGIADTEPEIYNNTDVSLHNYKSSASDSSVKSVVQGYVSNCPDLNTGSDLIQNAVVDLLKECIDCGVDGFRFDAAKHIETPDDGDYASDYWPNVLGAASDYASSKYGKDEYYYGEILNTCGGGRKVTSYTKYLNVTDNAVGNTTLASIKSGNAQTAAKNADSNKIGAASSDSVLWAESHDTYMGGESTTATDTQIVKTWALVAAQNEATSLFFARPGDALMGEAAGDTTWKSTVVSEINKFHNKFVGQADKTSYSGATAYVTRGDSGIVLVNCSESETVDVNISDTGLADGTYTDTVTGSKFTVSGGVLSGTIGSTGVAVVYDGKTTPMNTNSTENCTFKGDSLVVTLGLVNATSGTYQIGSSAPVTYTGTTDVTIGEGFSYGDTITLTLTATDGTDTTTTMYKYVKEKPEGTGVYVCYKNSKNWKAPFYAYMFDELTDPENKIYNNDWPGEKMSYDEELDIYYYEVPQNLVDSPNTQFIVNNNNGGKQYPSYGAKTKLFLQGTTHLLDGIKWTEYTYSPVQPTTVAPTTEAPTTVPPTTEVPTTEPTTAEPTTEPTTAEPTTEPTTAEPTTEPTTAEPTTEPTTAEPTTEPTTAEPTTEPVPVKKYTVAGDAALTGVMWDPASNPMTEGTYEFDGNAYDFAITFEDVPAGDYGFKVTNGTWDEAYPAGNFTFSTGDTGYVKVYFNSETKEIAVDAQYPKTWELESIIAAGNGDGTWLNGANWDLTDTSNLLTEVEPGIWEITYEDIDAYDGYEVKFACNQSWQPYNWTIDGVLDGQTNTPITVPFDNATVTLRIDVNGFDFATGAGSVQTAVIIKNSKGHALGDVDGDGEVSIKDASAIQLYLAKLAEDGDTFDAQVADFNADGKVNIFDVAAMQMSLAGRK